MRNRFAVIMALLALCLFVGACSSDEYPEDLIVGQWKTVPHPETGKDMGKTLSYEIDTAKKEITVIVDGQRKTAQYTYADGRYAINYNNSLVEIIFESKDRTKGVETYGDSKDVIYFERVK